MNLKTPLAAALLMTAASALANPPLFPAPTPTFSLTSPYADPLAAGNLSLGSFQTTNMPDDAAFNCSSDYNLHIPYPSCTPQQAALRLSYIGPCGSSLACQKYFQRIAPNPVELQGQADGEAAAKENAKAAAVAKKTPAGDTPAPTSGEIYGPPVPPGYYDEQDKKAVAEARREIGSNGVKDVVDLGGGKLAKMRDDGTVEMCGRGSCEKPVPADKVENPKIQAWVVENKGYAGVQAPPNGGGMRMNSNPPPASRGNPSAQNDPSPAAPPEETSNPYGMGREVASQSPKSPSSRSSSGSSFGSSGADTASVASAGENEVIARTPDQVKEDAARGITFTVNRVVEETVIPGVAASANAAFADGAKQDRIDVDSTLPKDHKAGPQAAANSGAPER